MNINDDGKDNDDDRKLILIMRYKSNIMSNFISNYCSVCNLLQLPALINIMGHRYGIGKELSPFTLLTHDLSIYDYYAIATKSICGSGLRRFPSHPNASNGLDDFLQQRPNYFLIESRILSLVVDSVSGDGKATFDEEVRTVWIPVILKDRFYYICPARENTLIYRVHYPASVFFTSRGHDVLRYMIMEAYQCVSVEINIILPAHSEPVANWDKNTDFDIDVCVPYPVVSTNEVPDNSLCAVQKVCLNDGTYIKDVVVNYETSPDDEVEE